MTTNLAVGPLSSSTTPRTASTFPSAATQVRSRSGHCDAAIADYLTYSASYGEGGNNLTPAPTNYGSLTPAPTKYGTGRNGAHGDIGGDNAVAVDRRPCYIAADSNTVSSSVHSTEPVALQRVSLLRLLQL
ncbi:hypothetical protein L914_14407 [Phytophthora nicotianae]|uniref:Uncharacterized protein n=2 Tax=Phytophthora nicotianae TaxID=4792 RepID=V9EMZ0_PHYNI|nr:hypothetical protein F443_14992 [Phytophthora nicotianae P1569]ETM39442.1 hypothetical protein L914_14407 [Phytophthora nicotianae]